MWGLRVLVSGLLLACLVVAVVGGWSEWDFSHTDPLALAQAIGSTSVGLSWAVIGGVLAWLRPRNSLGWLMLVVGFITQVGLSEDAVTRAGGVGPLGPLVEWAGQPVALIVSVVTGFAIYLMMGLLPVLYPTGALPGREWRWPSLAVVAGAVLLQTDWARGQDPAASELPLLSAVSVLVYGGGTLTVWLLAGRRLLRARYPERQQLAWLLVAVVAVILTQFLGNTSEALWVQLPFLYLLPVAIAIGILRYRLLGIETVLRRGLVYGLLTGTIFGVYAAIAVAAGVQLTGAALPAVITAGLVAVGLAPLRASLQAAVDRLLFGHRGDPIRAVAELGGRVARARENDLLAAVLMGVQDSVRAKGLRIQAADGRPLAEVGEVHGAPAFSAELAVGGTYLGELHSASRGPGERYSPRDERMLRAMVPQVAVVVLALQLAEDLGEQRDAVVGATQRERDRLRRELHDGLGPSLTGVGLGLRALADALEANEPAQALQISEVLSSEVADAVAEVRQILRGLGPVALAGDTLGDALRRQISSLSSSVALEVRIRELPPMSVEVEQAVYRVAGEAANNAIKHASASRIVIEVGASDTELTMRVSDNGNGFAEPSRPGIGLISMRDRASAVGGWLTLTSTAAGTEVCLTVPIAVNAP